MSEDLPGWMRFSSDMLPERDRFSYFRDEFFRFMVALDIIQPKDIKFGGAVEMTRVGDIELGHTTSTEGEYVRTGELLQDGRDNFYAIICTQGLLRCTQGDTERAIRPGEAVICDAAQLGGLYLDGTSAMWAVGVSRERARDLFPVSRTLGGTPLVDNHGSLTLLRDYIQRIRQEGPIDPAAAKIFGSHMLDLFALSYGGTKDQAQQSRRGLRAARLSSLLAEIQRCSVDPELSAYALAQKLGVSARYVHTLLEETGQSLSEHLLERRLDHAAAMLRSPGCDHMRISDIAHHVGFADLSHFNRSFRRRFGDTPSGFRR